MTCKSLLKTQKKDELYSSKTQKIIKIQKKKMIFTKDKNKRERN